MRCKAVEDASNDILTTLGTLSDIRVFLSSSATTGKNVSGNAALQVPKSIKARQRPHLVPDGNYGRQGTRPDQSMAVTAAHEIGFDT